MQETCVNFLGWEDTLENEMVTHSSILAWRIPWIEEPCKLPSTGSQRVRHDWITNTFTFHTLIWDHFWVNYMLPILLMGRLVLVCQFSSVQSLSRVWLFVTPWTTACQASLSLTNSRSLPKFMSIESVMSSSHLILCRPLLLLPPIPPSIRVFSNESALSIRWPKYWSSSFSISPSSEYSGLISFRMDWLISLQSRVLSRVFSNTTVQKHQFFSA